MQATIRYADENDVKKLQDFLTKAKLGIEGITEETAQYFLLLEDEQGNTKGTLGIEPAGKAGLLRSLAIAPGMAEKDIFVLFDRMLVLAKAKGIETLYLATNKPGAIPFFQVLGFRHVDSKELPVEITDSQHVQRVLCVDNSLFLKFSL
ncbi:MULTISPECIES: GNAT family N-acetyltransferase [unclassified Bacillus (in: firmicutes)]|uniref:GNAT family N-acetyltransferase n=1 Tax=unclassified Bacillus (in: firmicutes) TaxID=185979 RepID=UPI0008F34A70|nr:MULTISPECIES: hypothetical protein [unclassified Bacillus (in: firmicutes)]SFB03692.1 N-acetylglutamate synthase, GNAT family [Bacillus sp. UNCCL13]SFQ88728.1 N-acetylglutamate synthase, GNAT family [Bacillus sp. cl95]